MKNLEATKFFIEANSYEQLKLWEQHHTTNRWEQIPEGFSVNVGSLGANMPVIVSFFFAKINDVMVSFYSVTSRYSDMTMVEEWIKKHYPVKWDKGSRIAMTDAMNFSIWYLNEFAPTITKIEIIV